MPQLSTRNMLRADVSQGTPIGITVSRGPGSNPTPPPYRS
ncbi:MULTISPECIES: hypothetical protein [Bradyrhizobium]|nr:hypothetical protein [Bradyrhizobium elkanii]